MSGTLAGSIDLRITYAGPNPSVISPPVHIQQQNYELTSFTCACDRKSILLSSDINGKKKVQAGE
jgi:hypothetical protein